MKQTLALRVSAALAATAAFAAPRAALAEGDAFDGAPNFEMSLGIGAMHYEGNVDGIDDTGPAINFGIRLGSDSIPLGFEARVFGSSFSLDDGPYGFSEYDGYGQAYLRDADLSLAYGDLVLLLNLNRSGVVNPYIGGGVMWGYASLDGDIAYAVPGGVYKGYVYPGWVGYAEDEEIWDEDGATYILRAGLDIRLEGLYVRLDVGYLGELFDEDEDQFLLYGDIGVPFCRQCRFDVFGQYLTDYESFAVGVGVTLTL